MEMQTQFPLLASSFLHLFLFSLSVWSPSVISCASVSLAPFFASTVNFPTMILPPCSEVCIYSCIYREVVGFRVGGNDFWFALQRGTLSVWVSESAIGEDPCSP